MSFIIVAIKKNSLIKPWMQCKNKMVKISSLVGSTVASINP